MRIVNEDGEAMNCSGIGEKEIAALSKDRLQILKMLSKQPMYAAEIARKLGIDAQALHYHLKLLQNSGLIKFAEYEEHRGGMAKKCIASADSLAIILKEDGWKHFSSATKKPPALFAPFIENNAFNGKFVVGSPDPHGKYRARGSEFPILELAMMLGQYGTFSFPLYLLDTQVKEQDKKQNLIIAGGPKVNVITAGINDSLPIRFEKDTFDIYSAFSKKRYSGNIGIIELLKNPFSPSKKLLIICGLNHNGTRAAILSILKKMKSIEAGNKHNPKQIAKIVEGFDEDGDGIIDNVEILE